MATAFRNLDSKETIQHKRETPVVVTIEIGMWLQLLIREKERTGAGMKGPTGDQTHVFGERRRASLVPSAGETP